jgi:hypothetical protein
MPFTIVHSSTNKEALRTEKVRKNFHPSKDPKLEDNSLQQPPTYLRNIETGKSKKEF